MKKLSSGNALTLLAPGAPTMQETLAARARDSLTVFTALTKRDYAFNWHHKVFCRALTDFANGKIPRLIVMAPPRTGKSELTSRRLPAFILGRNPDAQIIAASYADTLASSMNRDVQRIIDSPIYNEIFPETTLSGSQVRTTARGNWLRNSDEFEIVGRRGYYRSAGIGAGITGRGANFAIIDDPVKDWKQADSEAYREGCWDWYQSTLRTRLEKEGCVLLTLTRWHEEDLAGRVIKAMSIDPDADQWKVIAFPMLKAPLPYEKEGLELWPGIDPRQDGQPLWEEKYSAQACRAIRGSSTPRIWGGLFQQNPMPDGGGLFAEEHFELVDIPAETRFTYKFATVDTAYKDKEQNDYHVFSLWGVIHTDLYLINCFRKQIKSLQAEAELSKFLNPYIAYGYRGTWIEPKGHGVYLNQKLRGSNYLIPSDKDLEEFYSDRRSDKLERANNVVPHLATRTVKVNRSILGRADLISEALHFPNGAHDDFVDTLVDALKRVYGNRPGILDVLGGK
jgi:predicted phage terminase large subunit-like protein